MSLLLMAALTWASQSESASWVALKCFQLKVDQFEAAFGRLPDPDEADLLIDKCMIEYDERKKEAHK